MRGCILGLAVVALALLPTGVAMADDATDIDVSVVIPEATTDLDDAVLSWSLNDESGSGAYNGSCNFLSAGIAGDAGSSRAWTAADGLYRASDGAVAIEKPTGDGWAAPTWDTRCLDERGPGERPVVADATDRGTGNRFVMTGGEGTFDPASGSAHVEWRGSVTVVTYGGLSYFWLTDPVLNLSDGAGSLTATLGGYGTSRDDTSMWTGLTPRKVTLATLRGVDLAGGTGFTATPAFAGVKVEVPAGSAPQVRSGDDWGAFPQSLIDGVDSVGQSAYWYSTGAVRDFAKVASPVSVSWSAAERVDGAVDPAAPSVESGQATTGQGSGGASSGGAVVAQAASAAAVAAPQEAGMSVPPAAPGAPLSGNAQTVAPYTAPVEDPRALLVIAASVLVALASIAAVGFKTGWLVLPGSTR